MDTVIVRTIMSFVIMMVEIVVVQHVQLLHHSIASVVVKVHGELVLMNV